MDSELRASLLGSKEFGWLTAHSLDSLLLFVLHVLQARKLARGETRVPTSSEEA